MVSVSVVVRFRDGDADAVRELYEQYGRSVFSVAYRTLSDRGLAEEAVQQTFVRAWKAADTIDPERDPGPWLHTIAKRVSIDLYRREDRRSHDSLDEHDRLESLRGTGEEGERGWSGFQVRRAVDQLPDLERDVMKMQHFLAMTHPEIAEQLGVPIGTVKSRSHRAHQRLTKSLGYLQETPDDL